MIWLIGHLLAVCIGLSLGLIGGGGSILAVPILVYVMGLGSKGAIAMSLVIVGTVSLIGAIPHWLQGNVNLKIAVIFTPAAMLGAYMGARIAGLPFVTGTFQLVCFGLVMVIASIFMIRKNHSKSALAHAGMSIDNAIEKDHGHHWLLIPVEGIGVGVLTGFVGVGGGFMIIPALVLLGGIPMKEAIGTSLLIIAAKSATGFLGYLNQVNVDWALVTSFTLAASTGTISGSYLTRLIDAKQLQKGFGYFVLAVAIFVLIKR
ncbi:permease [Leptolyngbya sp. Heron Island J]|uniref:sulfite exporter TauE/SafE family protein n=1 Tax=Leptolyngbya sp. Heron Island J TaxID=1385935 RepID=UPI0003B98FB1|nr:sulfite exporter TauE/SafE family protein [Leptolyngbya sp. Heron Island J]ESA38188.1 permease [Leptolyngbya sp. Heron Island J]